VQNIVDLIDQCRTVLVLETYFYAFAARGEVNLHMTTIRGSD
jgi:hypothetical protein